MNFYRALLHCRQANHALQYGAYRPLDEGQDDYLAFLRQSERQTCLVLMNYRAQAVTVSYNAVGAVLLSTDGRTGGLQLAPFEVLVLRV